MARITWRIMQPENQPKVAQAIIGMYSQPSEARALGRGGGGHFIWHTPWRKGSVPASGALLPQKRSRTSAYLWCLDA
eukprot:1156302-Pelagomonas_calceolata.AAC.3